MNATGKTMKDVIVFKPYENLFASMTVQAVEAFSRNSATLWFIARLDQTTGAYGLITAVASMYFPFTLWQPAFFGPIQQFTYAESTNHENAD